jgi:hypothetical protein
MNEYRVYLMRPDGHILSRVDLVCEDDEAAKVRAQQLVDGHDVELWQLGRKKRRSPATSRAAYAAAPLVAAGERSAGAAV